MATINPKKAVLQRAAADSYSKAGPEMEQAEPQLAKPGDGRSKPAKTGFADDKGHRPL